MEEKPPTQADRDVPRSRTARTTSGTPDQPTPPSKPAERAPRRPKAAPPVTFQAPEDDELTSADKPASPRKPTQRAAKKTSPARKAAQGAEPAEAAAETTAPPQPAAKAAPPARKPAQKPAQKPADAAAKTPAKRAPKRVPSQMSTAEAIDAAMPPGKPARAKKATAKAAAPGAKKVAPAQPAADATPPAKAMPAAHTPAAPANAAEDPAPAQAISDAIQPAKAAPAESMPSQPAQPREEEQRQPTTFSRLAADPGHAPELLALAAVQTIGPRAQEWAKRTRETYPKATDTALARLAADQFSRFTSPGSIVGAIAGSYAPAALLATTALTHARVVLHVAAAHGIDPTDEARAADLLVLTRVHPSRNAAEAALTAAKQESKEKNAVRRLGRMVATNAAGWAAVRLVRRYFPGSSLLAAALVSRSSARTMAERAITYYSQASHALGSSV